jgi:uncharacterized protein (TIGR02145 family)
MKAANAVKIAVWVALFAGITAAGVKYVAVVETEIDMESGVAAKLKKSDVRQITDEIREKAVNNLPQGQYSVMTSETVMAQSGSVLSECAEENCVITLGSKIGADYIVRGKISKFETLFTVSVVIYDTENGFLIASSKAVRSEKMTGLLEKVGVACEEMYKKFAGSQTTSPKPEPPKTYTVTSNVNPSNGGAVSRSPNRVAYNAGERVTIMAAPSGGYRFTEWSGGVTGTVNPGEITVDGDLAFTANFQKQVSSAPAYTPPPPPTQSYQAPAARSYQQSIVTGTFRDGRDGKTYRTVAIGSKTWMAENLDYKTGESWCYDNKGFNCGRYGRLYDWKTAMKVCPSGWHLPSRAEWDGLVGAAGGKTVAGKKLKSTSGWIGNRNGTDDYGFSALPGGYRYSDGSFLTADFYGNWWVATELDASHAYSRYMRYNNDYVDYGYNVKEGGMSVRCVGD